MEEANVLLELMIQRGKDPASFTYTTLMNGLFCLAGRLDDAKELFPSMESKRHQPDVVSCNVLTNELLEGKLVAGVLGQQLQHIIHY